MNKASTSPVPKKIKVKSVSDEMNFPDAMSEVIIGKKVRRSDWQDEDEYCLMRDGYLMIHRGNKFHTWTVQESDLTATDWVVIK